MEYTLAEAANQFSIEFANFFGTPKSAEKGYYLLLSIIL